MRFTSHFLLCFIQQGGCNIFSLLSFGIDNKLLKIFFVLSRFLWDLFFFLIFYLPKTKTTSFVCIQIQELSIEVFTQCMCVTSGCYEWKLILCCIKSFFFFCFFLLRKLYITVMRIRYTTILCYDKQQKINLRKCNFCNEVARSHISRHKKLRFFVFVKAFFSSFLFYSAFSTFWQELNKFLFCIRERIKVFILACHSRWNRLPSTRRLNKITSFRLILNSIDHWEHETLCYELRKKSWVK
jgi:hypothetical protein